MGDGSGFEVDLAAVRDFGARLRRDVDDHLAPEAEHALRTFVAVPSFGTHSASPALRQAAEAYRLQLLGLLNLMDAFVHNGKVMAEAAAEVVAAYEHVDAISNEDFEALIHGAALRVDAATKTANDAAHTASIDPKTGRPL